ncbi:MAG TPA: hypothetical protein VFG69_02675 [Nannocystaceae bacterium]|nr:hypothetical protein [Nannocystaceae bacterium]
MTEELYTCPRCATAIAAAESFACTGCGARHPVLDGVPCLLHDALHARDRFALRFDEVARDSAAQLVAIADELAGDRIPAATAARLHAFADGVRETSSAIAAIHQRAGLGAARTSASVANAIPSVAGHAALFDHYEYAFRDWGWGEAAAQENALGLERVIAAIGPIRAAPRVLVLGAGAGRLAYDLHHRLAASTTVALDIQPLLLLVARSMASGQEIPLAEFTANHLAAAHAVQRRTLRAPAAARAGLELALADATRPPVQQGAFDVVVTPWFLDQLACDVRDVLPGIHGALADAGRWVFFGPLLHPRGKPLARCVSEAELLEILPAAGFTHGSVRRDVLPYLCTPEGSARSEAVLTFAAHKRTGPQWSLPAWLRGLALPIPRPAVPLHASDPVAAAIAALLDGQRSALAIAGLLARRGGLDGRVALDATIAGLHALARAGLQ